MTESARREQSRKLVAALAAGNSEARVAIGDDAFVATHLDRVYWRAHAAQPAITKRDYLRYLIRASSRMLPHLRDRPLAVAVARWLRDVLVKLGLASLVKTSGKTGLHVIARVEARRVVPSAGDRSQALPPAGGRDARLERARPVDRMARSQAGRRRGAAFVARRIESST